MDKKLTDMFRLQAAQLFQVSCPEESRFLVQEYLQGTNCEKTEYAEGLTMAVCKYCSQWRQPDNYRVRLRPKCRPSVRVQRLKRRITLRRVLGPAQNARVRRFMMSPSIVMATCHTCNKTSRHIGMNRDAFSTFSTPGSSSKLKKPLSTNKTWSVGTPGKTPNKNKTPQRTPRSTPSTPGSISSFNQTPVKAQHWVAKRLTKILMREDKPDTEKGSLKDFLTALGH
ncbi:UPF0711 protein C18orf21 homolog [Stigmatopora nigra]